MAKYRKKSDVVDAIQFNYIDNFDGPETCELAKSLGLSRHGTSALWEIQTPRGWHIVYSGSWIITNTEGKKLVCEPDVFEMTYEPTTQLPTLVELEYWWQPLCKRLNPDLAPYFLMGIEALYVKLGGKKFINIK